MLSSFQLPALDVMARLDTSNFTFMQTNCSEMLRERLRITSLVVTFFDTEEIMKTFTEQYSNWMASKCIVKRTDSHGRTIEEIRFILHIDNRDGHLQEFAELREILYSRRSLNSLTFIELGVVFMERNLRENGIITEAWETISPQAFERYGARGDYFSDVVSTDGTISPYFESGTADRVFNAYCEHLIEHTFSTNHQHTVKINSDKFVITPENKEESNECKLCYADQSVYVCNDCKYPMCKECLKHILKSNGKCPCCRREGDEDDFTVQIVLRKEDMEPELIDDLNFDYEDKPITNSSEFTPEQINEEIDAEINGRVTIPASIPTSITLSSPLNDDEEDYTPVTTNTVTTTEPVVTRNQTNGNTRNSSFTPNTPSDDMFEDISLPISVSDSAELQEINHVLTTMGQVHEDGLYSEWDSVIDFDNPSINRIRGEEVHNERANRRQNNATTIVRTVVGVVPVVVYTRPTSEVRPPRPEDIVYRPPVQEFDSLVGTLSSTYTPPTTAINSANRYQFINNSIHGPYIERRRQARYSNRYQYFASTRYANQDTQETDNFDDGFGDVD